MRADIDGLEVLFPYASLYPEQRMYMEELKRALDAGGHAVLEMPSGTGKTITLLSLITSYLMSPARLSHTRKLIYCTRTVEEMQKVLGEMCILFEQRKRELGDTQSLLCVGLASRRHLCAHPIVRNLADGYRIDSACRALTAPWTRERAQRQRSSVENGEEDPRESRAVAVCDFYERYEEEGAEAMLRPGVYDIAQLQAHATARGWCPYFFARHMLNFANVIVYSYHYVLDPSVANVVSKDVTRDAIVVFDEAHNIDNVCIESLSVELDERIVTRANRCVTGLSRAVADAKRADAERLQQEYDNIMRSIPLSVLAASRGGADDLGWNPLPLPDVLDEPAPTDIRKAEHFLKLLRDVLDHLRARLAGATTLQESPFIFLEGVKRSAKLGETRVLQFTSDRLTSLLKTLEVSDWAQHRPLQIVSSFLTLASTYTHKGFAVIFEPFDDMTGEARPLLQLACLDASLAIKPVFDKFQSVVLTSGTISPLDFYPKMLNFRSAVSASLNMSLDRRCVCPIVMTRGSDQTQLSSRFQDRGNQSVARNFGQSLLGLAASVPDGVVAFFPSYLYMEEVVNYWQSVDLLTQLQMIKLVFVETQDPVEASLAIANYRRACDSGRGAVLLSVARGKAAEGIDFDGHYGRCVILFGVPFQYTESKVLRARLEFLRVHYQLREDDFLVFDAMRQAAQCVGRVIRNKSDYGVMIFADRRYARNNLRTKLPKWISQFLVDDHVDLDLGSAIAVTRGFLLEMAQPHWH